MAEPSRPQPRVFTIFDMLAVVGAAGLFVAVLIPAVRTQSPALVVVAGVGGLLLVPLFFVAAWYAMIGLIVATLWLFSVDREFPTNEPIFPVRWWDFRPVLVIGMMGGVWLACGVPLLGRLRWGEWDDWPVLLVLTGVVPIMVIGLAARRRLLAWLKPPQDPIADPPGGPTGPPTG